MHIDKNIKIKMIYSSRKSRNNMEVLIMPKEKLPTGIDSFYKIRSESYYYIDKTALIEQVIESGTEVILFTRPRRFGKSLNMSMLQYFF